MTETAKVYFYKVADAGTGEIRVPDRKATAETVADLRGELLHETGEEVDASLLDQNGRYDPAIGDKKDQSILSATVKPSGPSL